MTQKWIRYTKIESFFHILTTLNFNFCICSVIVEALKVDSLQRLCSSLEPLLRRIVSQKLIYNLFFGMTMDGNLQHINDFTLF